MSTLEKRALIVNQSWVKTGDGRGLWVALKAIGYRVIEISNNPEGWAELKQKGFCREHDFVLILFNGGNVAVDDMIERFLKQEVRVPPHACS